MGTKNVSTSQNQYNPLSMQTYNSMLPTASNAMNSEISNPYSNMFFNNQLGMMNQQIGAMGASRQAATNQSLQARGINPNSPMAAFMSRQNAMGTQAQQAQGYNNLLLNAANLRQSAISGAMNYTPLQTGQTQTQQTSGLGTWLPQLAGATLGAATAGMTGGMSAMGNMVGSNFSGNSMLSSYAGGGGPSYANPSMPSVGSGASFSPGQGYWNSLLGQQ